MKTKDIETIVGKEHLATWQLLNPTVYYLNDTPHGLLATAETEDGWTYIASTTRNPDIPFTKNMIRDIIRLYNTHSVCLISAHPPSWDRLQVSLSRYGFIFKVIDNVLYAHHAKV